ncbi:MULTISPECIES: 5'-nucleotidase, lipoprotein e(P4) family [Dickeya]|uniref:Outer membrane lipoprotein e (P4) / NMN 5'-nucleotidase, extracellular n=1 Tax=Dickeya aquatica TaxID=1401087 RepID=A0A375A8N1_9GAMM|nr:MULTISPECIES: 5'-nucleotidase, lipoprotein e(P4) family [Dickeya]SLM62276.1 Outer membrane lipoprotein e (P4) / NMN 5'-nucleotidase, extracellular [Dickeya aquatica]
MKKFTFAASALIAALALTGCTTVHQQDAQATLSHQSVLALNWFQQSGEYQALCYQAFNSARVAFDAVQSTAGKKKVVVVDIDETMLDNSAYSGWQAKQGQPFSPASWSRWSHASQARAVPGAVEFARYVNSHGGQVLYVSNRLESEAADTRENMLKLGFPDVNDQTLWLSKGNSNKQARFDEISAKGNQIVLYIGDNLNDFGAATYHKLNEERRAFVSANRAKFGTQFIVLPNPLYGDWESGLDKDYNKLSPEQKLRVREQQLRAWSGQ